MDNEWWGIAQCGCMLFEHGPSDVRVCEFIEERSELGGGEYARSKSCMRIREEAETAVGVGACSGHGLQSLY